LFGFVISDLTPNKHLTMILVWFSNQWFVFNKHTWIWFLSSFVISVLTSKRALENDYCFVLQSVIWHQTHTWQWFLSGFGISDLPSKHTIDNDSCFFFTLSDLTPNTHLTMILVLFYNQWFDDDSCLVLQSVIWSQTHTWRWFLSSSVMSDLTSKPQTHIWQWFLSSSVINYLILKHTTVNDFLTVLQSLIRSNSFR
jgi:hypothetical protein